MVAFPRKSGRHPARIEMFDEMVSRIPNANGGISDALKALANGYRDLLTQKARFERDETATAGMKLVRTARVARKVGGLIDALDEARVKAGEVATQLRQQVAHTYDPPNPTYPTCMQHQEIRAFIRAMPQGDRNALLENARKQGDEDTLRAVASCQPYLSGVAPQMHQVVRDHFIQTHAPAQAATLKTLAEQDELAEIVRANMLQSVADLVDLNKAEEIEAAARDDAAAA